MRNTLKLISLFILGITLIGYLFLVRNIDIKEIVAKISIVNVVILSLLSLGSLGLNGLRTKLLLDCFNVRLPAYEWFGLSVLNSMTNYLPLRGGIAVKAIYLKKIHQFSYSFFLSSTAANYAIMFLSSGVIGVVASLLAMMKLGKFSLTIFFSFLFLIVSSMLILLGGAKIPKMKNRFLQPIAEISTGLKHITSDHGFLYKLAALESLACLLYAFSLYYEYRTLSYDMPFIYCMMLSPLTLVSTVVSITPANLGVREIVIGAISRMIGSQFIEGVIVATLDRTVAMFWIFLMGAIFTYLLISKNSQVKSKFPIPGHPPKRPDEKEG